MEQIKEKNLSGERALYASRDTEVVDCIFEKGESPIKECRNVTAVGCMFKWYYPIWYSESITVKDSTFFEAARAGIWYCKDVTVSDCVQQAPKCFRRSENIKLTRVKMSNAPETLWHCKGVTVNDCSVKGDYFAMNSEDMKIDGLILEGKYSFDGVKNVEIVNSRLVTKDAFWNSENVTVRHSLVIGEYLGWNAKNLTLENCTIESLQGLCYIKNLVLRNCKLLNTTLAFEFSEVNAEVTTAIGSVFNPISGKITAPEIGELIIEDGRVKACDTEIICEKIDKKSDKPEWL